MGAGGAVAGPPRVHLACAGDRALAERFFLLFQQGVAIRRRVGCTVEVFLREEIGAAQETIGRIQSVLLDGRPVDDIRTAVVHDGATLALSAALPGLVGATLRRGGTYASFRSGITHRDTEGASAPATGWVTVKLFNLIMAELGPVLLRGGVLVKAADLVGLLGGLPGDLWTHGARVTLDGKTVGEDLLRRRVWTPGADRVLFSVCAGKGAR